MPSPPSGGHDNNYAYIAVDGALTVTQAPLTVSAVGATREYGEPNDAIVLNYVGFKLADTAAVLDTPPVAATAAAPASDVGNYPVTLSGGSDDNYLFTSYTDGAVTIVPAPLTVIADDRVREYGDPNPPLTFTYSGFKLTDDATVLDNLPAIVTAAERSSDAGSYAIVPFGGSDNNYVYNAVDGTLTVFQAPLTVGAVDSIREYGEANEIVLNYTGFKLADTAEVIEIPPTAATAAASASDIGIYPVTLFGGNDDNYAFVGYADGAVMIVPAPLTAIADDQSREYGDSNPPLTLSYSGFKLNDTTAVLELEPVADTAAASTSDAGDYPITLSGGRDDNYAYIYGSVNGTLTVNQAPLTVSASREYGEPSDAIILSYTGFKLDDAATVIDTPPTAVGSVQASDAGSYTVALTGGSDNNYTFASQRDTVLTIAPASLTATADDRQREYGDADPPLTISYVGFKLDDSETALDAAPEAAVPLANDVGDYPITLSGGNDNNYVYTLVDGLLTVTQAPLEVIADDQSLSFGTAIPLLTLSYAGFKFNDTVEALDTPPLATTDADERSEPGTYAITPFGGNDLNYAFNYMNGILNIDHHTTFDQSQTVPVQPFDAPNFSNDTDGSSNVDLWMIDGVGGTGGGDAAAGGGDAAAGGGDAAAGGGDASQGGSADEQASAQSADESSSRGQEVEEVVQQTEDLRESSESSDNESKQAAQKIEKKVLLAQALHRNGDLDGAADLYREAIADFNADSGQHAADGCPRPLLLRAHPLPRDPGSLRDSAWPGRCRRRSDPNGGAVARGPKRDRSARQRAVAGLFPGQIDRADQRACLLAEAVRFPYCGTLSHYPPGSAVTAVDRAERDQPDCSGSG